MVWLPADSADVEHVAAPPATTWLPHPEIVAPPSRKSTVPVGLVPVMVAVNVTVCPVIEGFADEPSAVELMTCASYAPTSQVAVPFPSPSSGRVRPRWSTL